MILDIPIPTEVVALRSFGSRVRGDAREDSDWDVLAIIRGGSRQLRKELSDAVQARIPRSDVSFYGVSTIQQMYATGHLFAWHLYRESKSLVAGSADLLAELGPPAPYVRATDDIADLRVVLDSIESSVLSCPERSTFEAGLLFVCSRNIALSASWFSSAGLDFSREAPIGLKLPHIRPFPLTREEYAACARARIAGTRGIACKPLLAKFVAGAAARVSGWAHEVSVQLVESS
jgi:hypothetical protein